MDGGSSSRPYRNLASVAEHSYHDSVAVPPFVDDEAQGYVFVSFPQFLRRFFLVFLNIVVFNSAIN